MSYIESLKEAVRQHPVELVTALGRARESREQLERELWDLNNEIVALEWIKDLIANRPAPSRRMTLHDAMAEVLKTAPGRQMRPAHLAAEIDRRGLYRMRDGRSVETQQIHARSNNYPELFKRSGSMIELV